MKMRHLFCLLLLLPLVAPSSAQLAELPWKGVWISHEVNQSRPNQWYYYVKKAALDKVPAHALARIAAESKYWLWINGTPVVYEGGLKRGPEPGAGYYDEVDIAPYLKTGENKIAVLLWHFGKNSFSHSNSGHAGLLFDCQTPGAEIVSDTSWICDTYHAYSSTEAPEANYRLSESNIRFDARKAFENWWMPGHEPKTNPSMVVGYPGEAPFGKLIKRPIPQWKDYGLKPYVRSYMVGDTLFCALPYNAQISPWFKVLSPTGGDTIRIQTDNYLAGNGNAPSVRAEYITKPGEQEYESLGWMNGHFVKYVFPKGVKVMDVQFRETGYNTEFVGSFSCSDPFMNELWKRAARTLYVNMRDNYFDCPERERAQWWGDVVNELGEAFYTFDPQAQKLATKGIYELVNWQRPDGVMYAPVPAGNWTRELPAQTLASVGWYGFYTQYFYSGDSSFVATTYPRVHRYLHDVWKTDKQGLVIPRTGDWSWIDWGTEQDFNPTLNCWYYLALKAEREFARMLGKTQDERKITGMMQQMEQNFDKRFWTGNGYRDPDYKGQTDDRVQAMAILSGLAPKERYPILTQLLTTNLYAGPYMEKYVLEALFAVGEPQLALDRIRTRYEEMLDNDYTTLFEVWNYKATPTDGNTNNHGWTGGPLTLLSQKVCGIAPTSAGFKTFCIAPQLGNLTEAEASIASSNGTICAKITRKGDTLTVTATVPEGTAGVVRFPSGKELPLAVGTQTVKGK